MMLKHSLAFAAVLALGCLAGCGHLRTDYPPIEEPSDLPGTPSHNTAPLEPGATYGGADRSAPDTASPEASPKATSAAVANARKASLSKLYGLAVRASHVVYVIDRNTSTPQNWQDIRKEVLTSIGDLWQDQDFTVILMSARTPRQGPAKGLIVASKHNQALAAQMLLETEPAAPTDPVAALRMAVAALRQADSRPGKVVYFVTDRAMIDAACVPVVSATDSREVVVMTYLVGCGGPDAQAVLEKLADATGGKFTHVSPGGAE